MTTLKESKVGDTVRVVKLHGEGAVKRRIMDMGLTKGVDVQIRKVAPLGDPIEVTVRGYELSRHLFPFPLHIGGSGGEKLPGQRTA